MPRKPVSDPAMPVRDLDEQIARALGAVYVPGRGMLCWQIASEDEQIDLYARLRLYPQVTDLYADGLPRFSGSHAAMAMLREDLKRRGIAFRFSKCLIDAPPELQAQVALEVLSA